MNTKKWSTLLRRIHYQNCVESNPAHRIVTRQFNSSEMKKIILFIFPIIYSVCVYAQILQPLDYQIALYNRENQPLANQEVSIRISILKDVPEGEIIFSETHNLKTTDRGIAAFSIGKGTSTQNFSEILRGSGIFFIRTEADPSGGSQYSVVVTQQLLQVPTIIEVKTLTLSPPTAITEEASQLASSSAVLNGIVNGQGFSTDVIFEWGMDAKYGNNISANPNPVTGLAATAVRATIEELRPATTYHYRIKAANAIDITYGEGRSFTTARSVPQLTTAEVADILMHTAPAGGTVLYNGGAEVISRGVVWSRHRQVTILSNEGISREGSGSGSFTTLISGLKPETTYYIRAFATNIVGTAYGEAVVFTTKNVPALTTLSITDMAGTTVKTGGHITGDGGAPVLSRGVCWSQLPNPDLSGVHTSDGSGTGIFSSKISGLTPAKTFYVRAYATNEAGTGYGNQVEFIIPAMNIPCPGAPTVTDVDGNIYNTVLLGSQCWMKENLKTTWYRNEKPIAFPDKINTEWESNTTGAYAWYDNDINYKNSYGALYNWFAVSNANGLCPEGWHVPGDAEWTQLTAFISGGTESGGNQLKSCRQVNAPSGGRCATEQHPRWDEHSVYHGTDEYGFSALPAGSRDNYGNYNFMGFNAYFWSASEHFRKYAWLRTLYFNNSNVLSNYSDKRLGFSVRCLRD